MTDDKELEELVIEATLHYPSAHLTRRLAAALTALREENARLNIVLDEWTGCASRWRRRTAKSEAALAECIRDAERVRALYDELLYCVANKYPHESRHETAKRYLLYAQSNLVPGKDTTTDALIKRERETRG